MELTEKSKLTELLKQKLELFEQICKLYEKHGEDIKAEQIEALDTSIDKVQEYIKKINGLHQEYEPLMQSYALLPQERKDADIENLKDEIQKKVELCSKLNEQNQKAIKEKLGEQTEKIEKQSTQRKGITGYMQAVAADPEMFDRKT